MGWVKNEKAALVATLRAADPTAATLCEGWDVRRLLAHLVVREQEPLTSLTDVIARKAPGEEPGLGRLVDGASTPTGYAHLVDRFAVGPPKWSPMSWAAEQINFIEYVIHDEDIRRAGPDPAQPRELPNAEQDAIWKQLSLLARLGLRSAPTGVRLARPSGETRTVKSGAGVTLTGEPAELALYVSGRRGAAQVAVTGSPEDVEKFTEWAHAS